MSQEGADYAGALADAQALGYAEADPTADVEGYDAGAKAAIIASIVFGVDVRSSDVDVRASHRSPPPTSHRQAPRLRHQGARRDRAR